MIPTIFLTILCIYLLTQKQISYFSKYRLKILTGATIGLYVNLFTNIYTESYYTIIISSPYFYLLFRKIFISKPIRIGLEGNISAGKSTLCRAVDGKYIDGREIIVFYELVPKELLKAFYSDMKKYALT